MMKRAVAPNTTDRFWLHKHSANLPKTNVASHQVVLAFVHNIHIFEAQFCVFTFPTLTISLTPSPLQLFTL